MSDEAHCDIPAERAVLGAMMTAPNVIDEVCDLITRDDIYQPRHQHIWDAILTVNGRGNRPDVLTVAQAIPPVEFSKMGPAYLAELTAVETVPSPAQAPAYARMVAAKALARRLTLATVRIRQRIESAEDMQAAAEDARRDIDEAVAGSVTTETGVGARLLLEHTLDALQSPDDPGLTTPWADLDEHVNGLRPGQLCIIGARPSVGKSVLAANLASHVCRNGVGVHFASLEMTRDEVMKRMLSAQATVDLGRLLNHQLDERDWSAVGRHSSVISDWPLWVDDTESQTLMQVRARARNTGRRHPLGMVIVDYLQLMAPRDRRVPREQQVGELSEGLKSLAKELRVPVVALAQVNRGPMDRQDKRPQMSDLRESGRIEADADHVWLLHRPDLVDGTATGELEVAVAKNRNGRNGNVIRLAFQGHYSRATSMAAEYRRTA